jgi:hypothetical protein
VSLTPTSFLSVLEAGGRLSYESYTLPPDEEVVPQLAPHRGIQVELKPTRFAETEAELIGHIEIRLRIFVKKHRVPRRGEREALRARRFL